MCGIWNFQHGNTALHEAAWRGYSRCVKHLCTFSKAEKSNQKPIKSKNGKNSGDFCHINNYLNSRNAGGFSALHLASQNGHNQSCREILLAGADPDIQNNVKSAYSIMLVIAIDYIRVQLFATCIFSLLRNFSMVTHRYIHRVDMVMPVQLES